MEPERHIQNRIAKLLGAVPTHYTRVTGGYTPAARWICETNNGRFFAKIGTTPLTGRFLRREARNYALIRGNFLPQCVAWEDDPDTPILVLEDLSQHTWPPPWTRTRVEAVLDCIREMHRTPASLESYAEANAAPPSGWSEVARDPLPLLSLTPASAAWLERALPALLEAEALCATEGEALCHWDIRSDNLCLRGERALLVDWNLACRSNPKLDLGFWLPSLAFEGGPLPETILPDAPEVAAWVSGFFACRAGLPTIPDAPRVRLVQRQQLETALPWAIRALGLPSVP